MKVVHIKDGFNSGGYEWCCNNWGTKWGIYDAVILSENFKKKVGTIKYKFLSAWSPPLPVIKAMSEQFPSLTFKLKCYECGMQFQGTFIIKNGKELIHKYSQYSGSRGG